MRRHVRRTAMVLTAASRRRVLEHDQDDSAADIDHHRASRRLRRHRLDSALVYGSAKPTSPR
ncbi:MAG: hypothetical protein ACR2HY_01980 [Acidimicrobiales bacterium]